MSETETRVSFNNDFRDTLYSAYGILAADNPKTDRVQCMITGIKFPREYVVAGHIVGVKHRNFARLMLDMQDIMHPSNGVLWCKALEQAWTDHKFCFTCSGTNRIRACELPVFFQAMFGLDRFVYI